MAYPSAPSRSSRPTPTARSFVRPTTSQIPSRRRRGGASGSSGWSQPRPASDKHDLTRERNERASGDVDRVSDADDARLCDACPDPEREGLARHLLLAVRRERGKGVEI